MKIVLSRTRSATTAKLHFIIRRGHDAEKERGSVDRGRIRRRRRSGTEKAKPMTG